MSGVPGYEHDALFYDSDEVFAATLVSFLRDGLERGYGAVAATTRDHIALLRDGLGGDADAVTFLVDDDWYIRPGMTVAGWDHLLGRFEAQGLPYAHIIGEVKFRDRTQDGLTTWTRYESALNGAFAGAPAWIVCPYDVRTLPERVVEDAKRTHPTLRNGSRFASDHYEDPAALLSSMHEPVPSVDAAPDVDLPIQDLAAVRAAVRSLGATSGLPTARTEELTLAVGELAANAIRHGHQACHFRAWADGARIVCEVTDEGEGIDDPLAGYVPPPRDGFGGMGLWLVRQLCDSVAISSNGRLTRISFSFS